MGVCRPAICEAARLTGTVVDKQLAIEGARPSSLSVLSVRHVLPILPIERAPVSNLLLQSFV